VDRKFSALQSKERKRQITAKNREEAWHRFGEWVRSGQIKLHPLTSVVLKKANSVLKQCHPAVPAPCSGRHSYGGLRSQPGFPFCTNDRRMRDAADVLAFPSFPKPKRPQLATLSHPSRCITKTKKSKK